MVTDLRSKVPATPPLDPATPVWSSDSASPWPTDARKSPFDPVNSRVAATATVLYREPN